MPPLNPRHPAARRRFATPLRAPKLPRVRTAARVALPLFAVALLAATKLRATGAPGPTGLELSSLPSLLSLSSLQSLTAPPEQTRSEATASSSDAAAAAAAATTIATTEAGRSAPFGTPAPSERHVDNGVRAAWRASIADFLSTVSDTAMLPSAMHTFHARPEIRNHMLLVTIARSQLSVNFDRAHFNPEYGKRCRSTLRAVRRALRGLRRRALRDGQVGEQTADAEADVTTAGRQVTARDASAAGRGDVNVTFLMDCSDGGSFNVSTVAVARHYRHYRNVIPAPFSNERGLRNGWGSPLEGWDDYINKTIGRHVGKYPWDEKQSKAVFRGAFRMRPDRIGSCNRRRCEAPRTWKEVNRGLLYVTAIKDVGLFDIGFTKYVGLPGLPVPDDVPWVGSTLRFFEFMQFKYVINVGASADWAERLRSLFFMNSAVVLHEAETKEFYHLLLKAWVHYIPVDLMFRDLSANVRWAREHDDAVRHLVERQNEFARRFLSEAAMHVYWQELLLMYGAKQQAIGARTLGATTEEMPGS